MARVKEYDMEHLEEISLLGKALSSTIRLEMLNLLYEKGMIIGDIAKELDLPASSAAFHLRILEQAGLIHMEEQPGSRGLTKYCTLEVDYFTMNLVKQSADQTEVFHAELPVGAFSSCNVFPTCGLRSIDGPIGNEDREYCFYYPERMKAGLLWSSAGFVEYKFANGVPQGRNVKKLSVVLELCAEAPGYKEDWKSDISFWVNGIECGMWTSPGDYGARRGRYTPANWTTGRTQYGDLINIEITQKGTYINQEKVSEISISQLELTKESFITIKIGNKEDAKHIGGFNLFGKGFGDYDQDILLTVEY